jgi:uncharacterized damage-inducible protein DinB
VDVAGLLRDLYGRVPEVCHDAVEGLSAEQLVQQPGSDANTIGWLVWHLARVQDAQIAELIGADQLWVTGGWAASFGLEPDPDNHGYGHTPQQVLEVRPESANALLAYLHAVAARTDEMLAGLTPGDLDRIVDENWDPPVTMGVRLISVADDCVQHAGQAAYVRGLLESNA